MLNWNRLRRCLKFGFETTRRVNSNRDSSWIRKNNLAQIRSETTSIRTHPDTCVYIQPFIFRDKVPSVEVVLTTNDGRDFWHNWLYLSRNPGYNDDSRTELGRETPTAWLMGGRWDHVLCRSWPFSRINIRMLVWISSAHVSYSTVDDHPVNVLNSVVSVFYRRFRPESYHQWFKFCSATGSKMASEKNKRNNV